MDGSRVVKLGVPKTMAFGVFGRSVEERLRANVSSLFRMSRSYSTRHSKLGSLVGSASVVIVFTGNHMHHPHVQGVAAVNRDCCV